MRTYNQQIVSNAIMNTGIMSQAIELSRIYGYSIQAVYTGTPTGTLKLQGSSDPSGDVASPPNATNIPVNWSDILNSSQAVSAAGNFMWNVSDVQYNWVRLVYTDGSGGSSTAILNARINAKGF